MDLTRRFIFNGHASAIGGRIVRTGHGKTAKLVKDGFIDVPASALGVAGGRSSATVQGGQIAGFMQWGGGSTSAEGVFDDVTRQYELTLGQGREDRLATTTVVRAELRELAIGIQPQLMIERVRASLVSQSSKPGGETRVRVGDDTKIEGVTIDGKYKLRIDLNVSPFGSNDTLERIVASAGQRGFAKRSAASCFTDSLFGKKPAPGDTGNGPLIRCTIVRAITWAGKPHPAARIDGHTVTIEGIGTLFFGELIIERGKKRLTMVRGNLGSPDGGFMCSADVQDGGTWSI